MIHFQEAISNIVWDEKVKLHLWFQFTQIRSALSRLIQQSGPLRTVRTIEKWMLEPIQIKGLLAKCYQLLKEEIKTDFTKKTIWEKEFKQQWHISYKKAMQISCNMNLKENGVKLHLQWHLTPLVLQKIYGQGGQC